MHPTLLFIYGTLHPDRAPAAITETTRLLKPFGIPGARATIHAQLYDLGAYPGIQLSDNPDHIVPGELFLLPEDPAVLARLDEYEDFRPSCPEDSLFLRQRTLATLLDGTRYACWVYTYNRPLPGSSTSR